VEAVAPSRVLNVLFLTIEIRIGGAERLVLELARKLDRRRFSPSIAFFADAQPAKEFVDLRVPLFPLRKQKGFDWQTMKTIDRIVREHRIDVIYANHFMPFIYACYAARRASRVGLIFTEHSEADVFRVTGAWRPAGAALIRRCGAVIGVSDRVSAALRSHFWLDARAVHTVENGVDVETLERAAISRTSTRKALHAGEDDLVIGLVANFRRNKNHLFLLKAYLKAFGGRTDTKLVFIGQGFPEDPENSGPEITAFIRDNGLERAVSLLGYRSDVANLMNAMDVFCLVSHKEGLPLSLIEAMACGLPVVATDIDGLREVVQPGVNGMVVAPDDVDGLARSLVRLASDPALRRRLGDAGRQTARRRYSFDRCLSQTEDLLLSVAPGGAAEDQTALSEPEARRRAR
jgi:glycosyltransferase involved in cell wall biosynthesis